MTPSQLQHIASTLPVKTIEVHGKPYLRRYYAGTFKDGADLWLHEFLSADGDRHLHNHPFNARSVVLSGWYEEETPEGMHRRLPTRETDIIFAALTVGPEHVRGFNIGRAVTVFDWHRIAHVAPQTWTAFIVEPPRLPFWYFLDENSELQQMQASPRKWWLREKITTQKP